MKKIPKSSPIASITNQKIVLNTGQQQQQHTTFVASIHQNGFGSITKILSGDDQTPMTSSTVAYFEPSPAQLTLTSSWAGVAFPTVASTTTETNNTIRFTAAHGASRNISWYSIREDASIVLERNSYACHDITSINYLSRDSPDLLLATESSMVSVWDYRAPTVAITREPAKGNETLFASAVSHDGLYFAVAGNDRNVYVYDVRKTAAIGCWLSALKYEVSTY